MTFRRSTHVTHMSVHDSPSAGPKDDQSVKLLKSSEIHNTLSARQKDGQRIGFLKTDDKLLLEMLSPLKCALLSVPPHKGFTLPCMVQILHEWNLYTRTRVDEHYKNYKLMKNALHNPIHQTLRTLRKLKCGNFQEDSLDHITNLHTRVKQNNDAWNIHEMMELQELLPGSQLLMVEVKPSDHSCHFLFVGPPAQDTIFILKEGLQFHGIKDPLTFFGKYCLLHS